MRTIVLIAALLGASAANAATAIWTGRMEQVQTVTYQWAWRCEYMYAGQKFWKLFQNSCPSSVEVMEATPTKQGHHPNEWFFT